MTGGGQAGTPEPDEVLAQRMAAQLLSGPPAKDPVAVTGRLLAVQGQDPRGFRLAIRARSRGLTAADVDAALTTDRSLVVTWLNRGTLHLVRAEDYWWLHDLTTPPLFTGNARRLAQEGVSPDDAERGVAAIERALTDDGPLTRAQLRERIDAAGVRTEGQALIHVIMLSCLRGLAVRGPMAGGDQAYVLVRDWLGRRPARPGTGERDGALTELARRYLAGHAPATDRDLAKWAGLPLRDARRGLAGLGHHLIDLGEGLVRLADPDGSGSGGAGPDGTGPDGSHLDDAGPDGSHLDDAGPDGSHLDDAGPGNSGPGGAGPGDSGLGDSGHGGDGLGGAGLGPRALGWPGPRLLGAFDPLLLGWASREQITGAQQGIVTANGLFRPFALVDGRAVAVWRLAGGELDLRPFAPLSAASRAALAAEAADVRRFLGLT